MTYISAELRRLVVERAGKCCEYCLISQEDKTFSFHIDHTIAEKHGGATDISNLCLSCPRCNTAKGSDIASVDSKTGNLTWLFNPRRHVWSDHFQLNGPIIDPLTAEGRVTIFMLKLNQLEQVLERDGLMKIGRYPCSGKDDRND
jgi:hypothetical protein